MPKRHAVEFEFYPEDAPSGDELLSVPMPKNTAVVLPPTTGPIVAMFISASGLIRVMVREKKQMRMYEMNISKSERPINNMWVLTDMPEPKSKKRR